MLAAELPTVRWKMDLQHYLDTYESTHDYDEYHFNLDEIKHDPMCCFLFCVRSMRGNGR